MRPACCFRLGADDAPRLRFHRDGSRSQSPVDKNFGARIRADHGRLAFRHGHFPRRRAQRSPRLLRNERREPQHACPGQSEQRLPQRAHRPGQRLTQPRRQPHQLHHPPRKLARTAAIRRLLQRRQLRIAPFRHAAFGQRGRRDGLVHLFAALHRILQHRQHDRVPHLSLRRALRRPRGFAHGLFSHHRGADLHAEPLLHHRRHRAGVSRRSSLRVGSNDSTHGHTVIRLRLRRMAGRRDGPEQSPHPHRHLQSVHHRFICRQTRRADDPRWKSRLHR